MKAVLLVSPGVEPGGEGPCELVVFNVAVLRKQ